MFRIDEYEVISQFREFMSNSGIKPYGSIDINADGQIHRFTVEGDRLGSLNGAYCLHLDNRPAGYVQDWKRGIKETFKYELSRDERRDFAIEQRNPDFVKQRAKEREQAEQQKAKEAEIKLKKERIAREKAYHEYLFSDLFGVFNHSYLKSRFTSTEINSFEACGAFDSFDVQPESTAQHSIQRLPIGLSTGGVHGGLCREGSLIIPMLNTATREFQTVIHIPPNPDDTGHYTKLNYKGLSTKGSAHFLEPRDSMNADFLFVAEGIATALAVLVISESKYPVYSCGSCHNLLPVCKGLKERYSNRKIVIWADNDENGEGIRFAQRCIDSGCANSFKAPPLIGDWFDFISERRKAEIL